MAKYSSMPFDAAQLPAELQNELLNCDYVEIAQNQKLMELLLARAAKTAIRSFALRAVNKDGVSDDEEDSFDDCDCKGGGRTAASAGLGCFRLDKLWVLHAALGEPVGSSCGVVRYKTVVLFAARADGGLGLIQKTCDGLIEASEASDPRRFSIYRWDLRHQYWAHDSKCLARPIDSVVLPEKAKSRIVDDVEDFLRADTKHFYAQHGIPYRRSYLFFGRPGAGKSSLISCLAGNYDRNLCYVTLSHKVMSDDALKSAVHRCPARSIIVMEDIDSVFSKDRSKKNGDCPLTFSGLLNALDGIGTATGQIFILTTNERHNLDEALIRHGRVDVQIEFQDCCKEQAALMFAQFYPDAADLGTRFADELFDVALQGRTLSTAALQGYFVLRRRLSAADALREVGDITKELDERDEEKALLAEKTVETKEKEKSEKKAEKSEESESEEEDDASDKQVTLT